MIIDKIENIGQYKEIPSFAIDFIKSLKEDAELGKVHFDNDNFANIESYQTKLTSDAKFESHDKYIDIQLLLSGKERIYLTDRASLTEKAPYDENRDITFYNEEVLNADFVTLDGTNFVYIFPYEAHAPQAQATNELSQVKKVVVKVKV